MYKPLTIQSYKGPYTATFEPEAFAKLNAAVPANAHFLIDEKVAGLYKQQLSNVLSSPSVLLIEATEANKSLDRFTAYVEHLVAHKARRGHILVAIGGGIIQDITCFLAATLFRGVDWHFYPTTLLAQADSCIGSKSSINVGETKNILGTFTPPRQITISTDVLKTLDERDVRSGVGEMLKVHVIEGPASFDQIAADYPQIFSNADTMMRYIYRSLEIKKGIIEQDEFDRNIRNIMNYGHSFGHAIEAATKFAIPHGIAVTMGMDMANHIAINFGLIDDSQYARMHPVLAENYAGFEAVDIPIAQFMGAISKDKKNTDTQLSLILPGEDCKVSKQFFPKNDTFTQLCSNYLEKVLY